MEAPGRQVEQYRIDKSSRIVSLKNRGIAVAGIYSPLLFLSGDELVCPYRLSRLKATRSSKVKNDAKPYSSHDRGGLMPYVYQDVDTLRKHDPPLPAVGDGSCVALIKYYVPGLKGTPTSVWRAGGNVLELGSKVTRGTAIATFVNGRYPNKSHGNHAAIVLRVMPSGIWVVDQWKGKEGITARLIRIPPPHQQYNQDGTFKRPSDNALAFYVIEK